MGLMKTLARLKSNRNRNSVVVVIGIGLILAGIVSGLLLAQGGSYSLYFLRNPDFDRNLGPWSGLYP